MKTQRLASAFTRVIVSSFVVFLCVALPAGAQVVFDAASNATPATTSTAASFTVLWNHTVGLAKKPYLVVSVSIDRSTGGALVGGVVYGREAGGPASNMTSLGVINNGTAVRAELWGLANPTPGTHQIEVTITNAAAVNISVVAGAKSFSNVFQTAATGAVFSATNTTLTPSVAVTNAAFDYVVDAVAYNGNVALTPGGGQTNAYNLTSAGPAFSGAGSSRTGANNVTMSWTATGAAQQWAAIAVALKSANPQILFDAVSISTFTGTTASFTGSWNHTTTNAANRYLIVGVNIDRSGGAVTGAVRYGTEGGGPNVAMTLLTSISNGTVVRSELYGLVAPASGVHQITVTITSTAGRNVTVIAGGQSFSNVDQSAPTGTAVSNSGNTVTPTVNVTNTAYDYVVDSVAFNGNNALTENGTQDDRYANNTNTLTNFAGGGSGSRGYTNTTMSWTSAAAHEWAISAIPLHQVTVGLTKTASADVIKLGDTVTYTLVATNYTSATVNGVTITDAIPAGATFVSQTGCAGTGPVTCTVGSLAANAVSTSYTITVIPNAAGTISNVATLTYTGAATAISSETVNIVAQGKVCATPGKDGIGGTLAGIRNDYWPGSASVAAGATGITIGARVAGAAGNTIAIGDLLIVMQMQDAAFDTTNDETYGEGTGSTKATGTGSGAATTLNNAGRWEYAIATNAIGAGGGALTIQGGGAGGGLLYSYTSQTFATTTTQGQRTFQVIRVPQYSTATLGSTLTALPWNGSTGGVLAVDISGTLALGGATVSVNGLGFRGGAGRVLAGVGAGSGLLATDFRTAATLAVNGSKGEGITGTPRYVYQSGATIGAPGTNTALDTGVEGFVGGSYGRGAPGNSGGGSTDGDVAANQDNSGGGGGGNGGSGGAGGFGWACRCPSGGQGGGGISPSLTRITMGGGGGSGTTNNGSAADAAGNVLSDTGGPNAAGANGYYSSGADGGGVVIIRALQATGTGTITANGFDAANVGRDGGGGGGAGGSVLFTTQTGVLTGLTVQAMGGAGGKPWILTLPAGDPGERHGPGGGGGGGYVLLSSAAASVNVNGGVNGVTTTVLDAYNAQPGTLGVTQFIAGNNVLPGGDGATCAVADLAVTDSAPGTPVDWLGNVTFTQTVVNNGPSPADSVVYTTSVPAASTFQSISVPAGWTCITPAIGGTGNITCTRPTLTQANGVQNFSLVVQAVVGTPTGYLLSNTNSVSSLTSDSNILNNTASATNPVVYGREADMSVTLANNAGPATTAGSDVIFTSVAKNVGASAATGATWSMAIPPNMNYRSMPAPPAGWTCITPAVGATVGTISCSATGTVASLATATFLPTFRVNAGTAAGTVITGTANTDATNDNDDWNNTATSPFTVRGAAGYDMVATMTANPDPVAPAGNVTFTSVVTNNGPNSAPATGAGVQWVMNVPANMNFQSVGTLPAGWVCATPAVGATAGAITCTYQVAGVNQAFTTATTSTFQPVFAVNASTAVGTTLTGSATVNINGVTTGDNVPANNTASDTSKVVGLTTADVSIVKSVSANSIGNGQLTNYSFAITNNGPVIATNAVFTDVLPAALTYQSHAVSSSLASCSYTPGTTTFSCSIPTLAVGNTVTITLIAQANTTGTIPNTASISGLDQTDSVAANNSSTANLNVFAVTMVRMRKLSAVQNKNNVLVTWETSFESDNLGFDLYREVDGVRTKITKKLIAGSALRSKKEDPTKGYSYRFRDKLTSESAFAQYWLEDVDLNGTRTMHGPATPAIGGTIPGGDDSAPLAGLGANGSILQSAPGVGVIQPLTLPAATSQQTKTQLDLAGDAGLKIYVSKEGWYRITRAQLIAAGYDPGNDEKKISLFTSGIELPIIADSDGIEFYGLPIDTTSTGARTYWLRSGKGNGSRIKVTKNKGGDPVAAPLPFTYDRIERSIHFAALTNNGDGTNFFGQVITPWWSATQDLIIGALDPSYGGNATMDVAIQGATDGFHHIVDLSLNGHDLGVVQLDGQQQRSFTLPFPQSFLINGTNTLAMTAMNGDMDVSVLADTRINYQHLLRADSGELEVVVPGRRSVTVTGFTPGSVRAVDVTDPMNPSELETTVTADGTATFTPDDNGARTVLVFDTTRVLSAPEMAINHPSTWNDGKSGADLLIVSNPLFTATAAPLAAARLRDGITSAIVDVDDIYDEMNFGIRDPQAIRWFLQSATKWKKAPKWVLVLGDASFDPRNYLDLGAYDFVPTGTIATLYLKTVSDDLLTDFDGDGIADIPIGRIPARTTDDASLVINRIASRGTPSGAWASNALFIVDAPVDFDFAAAAHDAARYLPASISSRVIDSGVASAMNDGALITDYIGHGSTEIWGTDAIFTSSDAATLTNGTRLPFVINMTCLTGAFHDLYTTSLAEALMFAPNGGAIAVWASSTLTEPDQQALMNNELLRQLFTPGMTLGEAARRAKFATTTRDIRTSWILFGDPSMKLK